nr:oleosin [Anacardium occidentale]
MSDHPRSVTTQDFYDRAPTSYVTVKFFTAAAIGVSLLFLAGLTTTGTVIALVLATPLLVLFSPILVPAGIVICLAAAGLLFSGGCGLTAITLLSWVYGYVTGKHPPGADQLDYARMKIAETARDMKENAKEYGLYVQHKAQEAAQSY